MDSSKQRDNFRMKELSEAVGDMTVSLHFDRRLYKEDIRGSKAHVAMLARQGIITDDDNQKIRGGLTEIEVEIEEGSFPWRPELEDIHMNIERRLYEKIGETSGKLHTARSRNDQVSLDMRMFVKESCVQIQSLLIGLQRSLLDLAESNQQVVIPGYTHLQKAQPVLFAHHILAYFEMFDRDCVRFGQTKDSADVMPLGSGALAGLPYDIDREYVAKELGFSRITANSMDAVSDRDFIIDFLSAAATCSMHLSRLAEEFILWSTEEFSMVNISDEYTTGSSIMPQKRNPDFAEIARGKTGRVFGNLIGFLTTMKGLPLTYNRDMQEDKESFFDSYDTLYSTLSAFIGMVDGLSVKDDEVRTSAEGGLLLATDIADYLVGKGLTFRESHYIVGQISNYVLSKDISFRDLTLEEYTDFSEIFEKDVYEISVHTSLNSRDVPGGTAANRVQDALRESRLRLESGRFE